MLEASLPFEVDCVKLGLCCKCISLKAQVVKKIVQPLWVLMIQPTRNYCVPHKHCALPWVLTYLLGTGLIVSIYPHRHSLFDTVSIKTSSWVDQVLPCSFLVLFKLPHLW